MKFTRNELLEYKQKFTDKPENFDAIMSIFNKNSQSQSSFWKPNSVIVSEEEKIKKNTFNILNKLTLDNFEKLQQSLIKILQNTNTNMIKFFIQQMITKCINEKTYNSLYVDLYISLKNEIPYFHDFFLEILQEIYENINNNGILVLIINLYKKQILNEYIIHNCLKQLFENQDYEKICILLSECGKELNHEKAKEYNKINYFNKLVAESLNTEKNGFRICFKIQDLLELYKNNWKLN
jgi:hypothetical protein